METKLGRGALVYLSSQILITLVDTEDKKRNFGPNILLPQTEQSGISVLASEILRPLYKKE